jgi:hypothetical protein
MARLLADGSSSPHRYHASKGCGSPDYDPHRQIHTMRQQDAAANEGTMKISLFLFA